MSIQGRILNQAVFTLWHIPGPITIVNVIDNGVPTEPQVE